jgi:trehalose/maltose hydrolase-like predicted phosphorylase
VPVAADLYLGRERVRTSQIVKQPDVLMLHHMVPEEMPPGSLERDLDAYVPRTAHGSSLSPAITAGLLARAGRSDAALELLRVAARLDLDDLTGMTAGGLHLATMGGLWQAVAMGFAGLRPTATALIVDPRLPESWSRLVVRIHYRGSLVRVAVETDRVHIDCDDPIPVDLGGHLRHTVPPTSTFVRRETEWEGPP